MYNKYMDMIDAEIAIYQDGGNDEVRGNLKSSLISLIEISSEVSHKKKGFKNKDMIGFHKYIMEDIKELIESPKKPSKEKVLDLFNELKEDLGIYLKKDGNGKLSFKIYEYAEKELLYLEDLPKNKEINDLLKVYHAISKPHKGALKYQAILSTLLSEVGVEKFQNMSIKFNQEIGLLIESKEGLYSDNQKIILSHSDLVPTFEKAHEDILKGMRKSALTIGNDGFIRGSLDNTLPNAVVLKTLLDGKFEDNVSILFEIDEETGMTGSTKFFNKEAISTWSEVGFNKETGKLTSGRISHEIDLEVQDIEKYINENTIALTSLLDIMGDFSAISEVEIDETIKNKIIDDFDKKFDPIIEMLDEKKELLKDYQKNNVSVPFPKDDCIVVGTDVTMGYKPKEQFAFESDNFTNKTKNEIKSNFPDGAQADYCFDDSTRTARPNMKKLSFCINVGGNVRETRSGVQFAGGCHSMATTTSQENIKGYLEAMPVFVKAIGNGIEIEIKPDIKKDDIQDNLLNELS